MSTWRILEVSVPVLPRLEEWLSHTYSFSCWLNTDCKREGPTLSAKFAVPWEVLELPYLLHTLSQYQGIAQSRHGAVSAILGGGLELHHLQLLGSKDLKGWQMVKKQLNVHIPILHILSFPELDRALSTPLCFNTLSPTIVYRWGMYGHETTLASQEGPSCAFCKMFSMLKMLAWLNMCLYFRCPKFSLLN